MGCLISMPSGLVGASIERFGTAEQKARWLVPLAQGLHFGGAGVTEPRSGSDVAGMTTTYRRDGDDFVINGAKAWITNVDIAEFFVTFASMDRSLRHRGITAFIVPRDTPGLSVAPYHNKLGFRPLCSGDLVLEDVRVGPEALLGDEGDGFPVAMTAVERGRLGVAARALGVAEACLEEARAFAQVREAFGQIIADFQIVQSKITDMVVGVETTRLLVRETAEALQRGERARKLTSMAKMYASDVAFRSAADAMQLHGASRRIVRVPDRPAASATPRCCRSSKAATTCTARSSPRWNWGCARRPDRCGRCGSSRRELSVARMRSCR